MYSYCNVYKHTFFLSNISFCQGARAIPGDDLLVGAGAAGGVADEGGDSPSLSSPPCYRRTTHDHKSSLTKRHSTTK